LVPRFARINKLGKSKAFWNHRHCWGFSGYKNHRPVPVSRNGAAFCGAMSLTLPFFVVKDPLCIRISLCMLHGVTVYAICLSPHAQRTLCVMRLCFQSTSDARREGDFTEIPLLAHTVSNARIFRLRSSYFVLIEFS